jgi:signal transduction histidine kinase
MADVPLPRWELSDRYEPSLRSGAGTSVRRLIEVVRKDDFRVVNRDDAVRMWERYRASVKLQRVWVRLRREAVDALFIVVAWAAVVEVLVTRADVDRLEMALIAPFWSLPLLFRRRYGLFSVVAASGALVVSVLISPSSFEHLNMPVFAALLTMVVAGSIADFRESVAAGVAALACVEFVQSRLSSVSAGDYASFALFLTACWLVGRTLTIRGQQAQELRARVRAAERSRSEAVGRAASDERARIARELHDVVAHSVSVMVVQASGVRRLLNEDQTREREALMSVEQIGRQALSEMRRMLGVMRTDEERPAAALAPQPGLEHLDRLIEQVEEAGLPVTLHVEGSRLPLSPGIDLSAYRIVQEGLTNALKHAKGARADVFVRYGTDAVELEIADDGPGSSNGDGMGHGLVGMRERVALYGGTLEAGPRPGGGYSLRAKLPVEVRS